MLTLKYVSGDFKDIPENKPTMISKFTEGKIAFNIGTVDKYAKEYEYKTCNFQNGILEIITNSGNAKFEATDKQYQKFVKMMESKPENKINHPILILVIIIVLIAFGIHSGKKYSSEQTTSSNTTNTTQETSKPATKATSKEFANSDITNSTVKDALKKAKGTNVLDINSKEELKSIDIIPGGDNNAKTVKIVMKPQNVNEILLAKDAASTIVNYAEILSKNKNIDKFILEFDEDFEDQYGKSSKNLAIWMEYSKDTMNKIEYDNFKESIYGDYTKAYKIADSYKIATGVYNKLKDLNGLAANK